ncbi:hypothetical protein MRB53_012808 [Persea americana]|uniref:Uncharacterized protein n=1 Tax=Persea americana TaxID=3435 RepID=A0ACC2LZM8_PERAE|nr:hypothetical protein MRB53_012808 [Persea americana]
MEKQENRFERNREEWQLTYRAGRRSPETFEISTDKDVAQICERGRAAQLLPVLLCAGCAERLRKRMSCERGGDVQRSLCVSTCPGREGELRKRRRSLAVEKKSKRRRSLAVEKKSFARRERESCEI